MKEQRLIALSDNSWVAEARRLAAGMARQVGFDEAGVGKVALIVTEAARNLVKYARDGELLIRPLRNEEPNGLEILSLDKGPGIANPGIWLADGYSTGRGSGTGLGAIFRLSDQFDIYSLPQKGTALMSRLWLKARPMGSEARGLEVGLVCLPKPGEDAYGDSWAEMYRPDRSLILLVDGLGHGRLAAEASHKARVVFQEQADPDPAGLMEAMHAALRSTRGAAAAIAAVEVKKRLVRFVGVGNISGLILSPEGRKSMVSRNGTLGAEVPKFKEFTYPWPEKALLIMHSDGLATHWRLDAYPGLARKHPSLIAGILYRDYRRGSDDVTVIVARDRAGRKDHE